MLATADADAVGTASGEPSGSWGEGEFGADSCVAHLYEAEPMAANIYVMFDTSGSMDSAAPGGRRIDAVRTALREFIEDPASAGLGIGLGVFGHLPLGYTSCDAADYVEPIAPFGRLPDNESDMVQALEALQPTGETPTGAAIRGACQYTTAWRRDHRSHYAAILFVTDGIPEASVTPGCSPTLDDAVDAATDCASGNPLEQVPTYVVGVGAALHDLNRLAAAGGTEQAYLVESDDVADEVLQALNAIRSGSVIQCEYQIPEAPAGEQIDLALVNVRYVDPDDNQHDLLFVNDEASCGQQLGGWYYDDPSAPTRLLLCPATCEQVTEELHAQLGVAYGCATNQVPR